MLNLNVNRKCPWCGGTMIGHAVDTKLDMSTYWWKCVSCHEKKSEVHYDLTPDVQHV